MLSPSTSNKSAGTTTTPTSLDLNNAKTTNTSLTATATSTSNTKYDLFNTSLKDLEKIFNFKIVSFENRQQVKSRIDIDNENCKIKPDTADMEDSSIQRHHISSQYTHQAHNTQRQCQRQSQSQCHNSNNQFTNSVLPNSSSRIHHFQTPRLSVPLTVLNELDSDLNSKFEKVQVEKNLKKRKFHCCNNQNDGDVVVDDVEVDDQSLIELKKRHENCHYSLFQSSTSQNPQNPRQQQQQQQQQLKKQRFNNTFINGPLPFSVSTLAKAPVTLPSSSSSLSSYSFPYNNHNGLLLMNNSCFMKELNNEFDENKLEVFNLQKEVIEPHYNFFYSSHSSSS
ncbi:unnamed protein product [Ambrosiozyma monospora]|uniref:Unnamed protein product n=1 Tax=Ambrosiozyma monospora TaxID=43982 RepID=A0A9W6Z348_AMBMO|nr:unnamed protein product [Ambrosiozyma monospora]